MRSLRLRQMKSAGEVPVFVLFYHRIADTHPNPWSMDFATFKQQVRFMQKHFDIVSMEEVQNRIASGFNDRPTISITFDDGYSENCEEALPFLITEKIPVTYFVTTQHTSEQIPFPHDVELGAPLTVNTIESLRALSKAGVEIGAHTRTHLSLGGTDCPFEIFDEVVTATRELEELVDQKINYFAFPFGQFNNMQASIFHLLKQNGIKGVCSAYGGWNEIGGDSFHIQRVHGDPSFARMQNWLTFDARIGKVERYDYSNSEIDWEQWQCENAAAAPTSEPQQTNPPKKDTDAEAVKAAAGKK